MSRLNRGRHGFSLAELVVVFSLASLVCVLIVGTLTRQQRFYRGASEYLRARESVRDAMDVLSTDIRGISAADTVRLLADSAIEFFATIGGSVVCQIVGNEVGLPPEHQGNSLSAFVAAPDTGDLALFHAEAPGSGEEWERHRIAGFASRPLALSCPPVSRLSRQSDLISGAQGSVVTLSTPLAIETGAGAPVRFIRRVRYSLYRAGDGEWYLGYRRCNATGPPVCATVQPVSGPYRPYSADPRVTGLLFQYFDAAGQRLVPPASSVRLARVDVTARSASEERLVEAVQTPRKIADSATVSIAIRNRGR